MEVKSTTQLRTEYLARASKIISGPREEEYGSPTKTSAIARHCGPPT